MRVTGSVLRLDRPPNDSPGPDLLFMDFTPVIKSDKSVIHGVPCKGEGVRYLLSRCYRIPVGRRQLLQGLKELFVAHPGYPSAVSAAHARCNGGPATYPFPLVGVNTLH